MVRRPGRSACIARSRPGRSSRSVISIDQPTVNRLRFREPARPGCSLRRTETSGILPRSVDRVKPNPATLPVDRLNDRPREAGHSQRPFGSGTTQTGGTHPGLGCGPETQGWRHSGAAARRRSRRFPRGTPAGPLPGRCASSTTETPQLNGVVRSEIGRLPKVDFDFGGRAELRQPDEGILPGERQAATIAGQFGDRLDRAVGHGRPGRAVPRPDSSSKSSPSWTRGEWGMRQAPDDGRPARDVDQAAARRLAGPPAFLRVRLAQRRDIAGPPVRPRPTR